MPTRNNRVTSHSQRKRAAAVQSSNSQAPVRNRYESNRQRIVREKQEREAARRSAAVKSAPAPKPESNRQKIVRESQERARASKPKPTYGSRVTPHSQRQAAAKQAPKATVPATPKPAEKKVAKPAAKKVAKKKSAFFTNREGRNPRGKMAALERRRARTAAAKKNK